MAGRFLVKDIALQAGVGVATVDRVINHRGCVHPQTQRRVERAIEELRSQERTVGLSGRKFIIDMVIEAPQRFCLAARDAMAAETPALLPAIFRTRHTLEEALPASLLTAIAERIRKRGSHGVIFMGPDTREAEQMIAGLAEHGVPVVTLASDVPRSRRVAYVGMDNRRGGKTAAHLIGRWLPAAPAKVLVSLRNELFRGEEEREVGFRAMLQSRFPHLEPVELREGAGQKDAFEEKLRKVLRDNPDIRAVYSIGGSNRTIVKAMAMAGIRAEVFVAHDLDDDNRALLLEEKISFVLHHDLRRDMHQACRAIMRRHKAIVGDEHIALNPIQVMTPMNVD